MKVESRNFKYEEYKKNETDSLRNWENLTGYIRGKLEWLTTQR